MRNMTKRLLVVVNFLLFLSHGPATAADVAGGSYNWTGFYAGLNAGGVVNDSSYAVNRSGIFSKPLPHLSFSGRTVGSAFTGGGQLGYNYQSGSFVFGLETDFNYDGVDESESYIRGHPSHFRSGQNALDYTVSQKVDFLGTFRGRLGYTPVDRFLVYATGGLAYGDVSLSTSDLSGDNLGSSLGFQTGWTVGGGVEYALTRCWTVKLEYLLIELGSQTYTRQFSSGLIYTTQVDATEHVFRLGANYRF
jgi:outer membrane immunogenic protein